MMMFDPTNPSTVILLSVITEDQENSPNILIRKESRMPKFYLIIISTVILLDMGPMDLKGSPNIMSSKIA